MTGILKWIFIIVAAVLMVVAAVRQNQAMTMACGFLMVGVIILNTFDINKGDD